MKRSLFSALTLVVMSGLVSAQASMFDLNLGLSYNSGGNYGYGYPYGGFPYAGVGNTMGFGSIGGFAGTPFMPGFAGGMGGMGYGGYNPYMYGGYGNSAYGPQMNNVLYYPGARESDMYSAGQLNFIGMDPSSWAPLFQSQTVRYADGSVVSTGASPQAQEILAIGMAAQPMSVVPMAAAARLPDQNIYHDNRQYFNDNRQYWDYRSYNTYNYPPGPTPPVPPGPTPSPIPVILPGGVGGLNGSP